MKQTYVSMFSNYLAKTPLFNINIWDWLLGDCEYTKEIYTIRNTEDKSLRNKLKSQLPAITTSGTFSVRKVEGLVKHSGLISIDIDGSQNPNILDFEVLKSKLSKEPYIMYCGLSVGGKGLFCLIPISNTEKHKQHFNALEEEFSKFDIVIDKACSDVSRLRGCSLDLQPYVNPEAIVYNSIIEESRLTPIKQSKRLLPIEKKIEVLKKPNHILTFEEMKRSLLDNTINVKPIVTKSKSVLVKELIERITVERLDITVNYDDWFQICCILRTLYDEIGRPLFHQISCFYPNYCFDECEKFYTIISSRGYFGNSNRLFEIAAKYGI